MSPKDDLQAFPAKMNAAAAALKRATPKAIAAGTAAMAKATEKQVRTVAPSLRLRNAGPRGAKVGVAFKVRGATGTIRAIGPLHLVESNTRSHQIAAKATGGRLKVGTGYRRRVVHPGTTGRHPFEKGIQKGLPATRQAVVSVLVEAPTKALK